MTPQGTERLTFGELSDADAPFILQLLNEPGFIRHIGDRGVRDLEGARRYVAEGPAPSYALNGYGLWRVGLRPGNEPVGICGLIRRDFLDAPDIGYAFLARFQGRGYAAEAAAAVLDHARGALGMHRVLAITSMENAASIRVLERIGLRFDRLIDSPDADAPTRLFAWEAQAPSSLAARGAK